MIHCSFDLVDKFVPRIPKNRCIGEDATIPRICAGQTIRGCLSSMPKAGDTMHRMRQMGLPVIIHAYYMRCKHAVFDIKDYVPDATTTGEIWLLESPSEVHRVDYEVRFKRCMWYTDPYGQQQRYPVGVRLRRTKYQDNSASATERATMTADIRYIRSSVDDIKLENKAIQRDIIDMRERVVAVEQSTKSAHNRIDEIVKQKG